MRYKTIQDTIGNTPLVQLLRVPGSANLERNNIILGKLEGNNPAGSVKDRPAISMIAQAEARGRGTILDQFANPDNFLAHYQTTGPEIWRDTEGQITHFVSAMGTTGTIMGVSQFLKEKNPAIQIIGAQPEEGSQIPGIRKWPEAYLPKIYDKSRVDRIELVGQADAENMARKLAAQEGIFAGISAAGACEVALRIAATVENATIVFVVCDRGDRYLSTGVFPA
ncbi:MAG: pyridoxal-phosphate dependent enzyme [Burkholderiales bacterium]|nr:pyridoxal-phosphate dependent enzyme [Burkholderiales bacterium]